MLSKERTSAADTEGNQGVERRLRGPLTIVPDLPLNILCPAGHKIFFKTIKQNLKIKTFVGTSPNALKTQIWTALISILLLKYLKFRSSFGWSLSNLVAMLRYNLFTYRDLWAWIDSPYEVPPVVPTGEQLALGF